MPYIENVTIGTDVEFFVADDTGEIVSAEGFIRGSKDNPYKFVEDNPYFATQLDNVLAEGNIPPCTNRDEWHDNILFLRNAIQQQLPKGYRTVACASAELHERFLTFQAQRFGCDPSYNVWTGKVIPVSPTKRFIRSAGFHVHVGYTNPTKPKNVLIAKFLDLHLGVASVLLEPESLRQSLGYGAAGNFRHQKHGVEYRVLSSYFASTPALVRWTYDTAVSAVGRLNYARRVDNVAAYLNFGEQAQNVINTRNTREARNLATTFNVALPQEVQRVNLV